VLRQLRQKSSENMTLVMTIYSPHCQGFMGIFQGKENDILINTHFIVRWIMHHYSSVAVLIPSQRPSIKQYWWKGAIYGMWNMSVTNIHLSCN